MKISISCPFYDEKKNNNNVKENLIRKKSHYKAWKPKQIFQSLKKLFFILFKFKLLSFTSLKKKRLLNIKFLEDVWS